MGRAEQDQLTGRTAMRMQFQIWFAGLNMGVDMKTRAQRIKKRSAKAATTASRKSKPQQAA
jgi:hypothetical protein